MKKASLTDTAVMLSGGVDSLIAWAYLDNPLCVHVDLDLPYSGKELTVVKQLQKLLGIDCKIVKTRFGSTKPINPTISDPFIPSRNLLLAVIGSWFASQVCIVGVKGDLVEDKNPAAFRQMSETITRYSKTEIEIISPFWDMTKGDAVKWFINSGRNPDALYLTTGCYHPTKHQCGECSSCLRKWVALKVAGLNPKFDLSKPLRRKYIERAVNGYYDKDRCKEILEALGNQ